MNFLHLYFVHTMAWMSIMLLADAHKNGVPPLRKIPSLLLSTFVIGLVGALISAHGHSHYTTYLKNF